LQVISQANKLHSNVLKVEYLIMTLFYAISYSYFICKMLVCYPTIWAKAIRVLKPVYIKRERQDAHSHLPFLFLNISDVIQYTVFH